MSGLAKFNLTLRALMETGIVVALGFWGYHLGDSTGTRVLWAFVIPVVGFGFWGAVDFRWARSFAEGLRLVQELAISGAAAVGGYASGQHLLAWGLALVSVVHHVLVYASGERLLDG